MRSRPLPPLLVSIPTREQIPLDWSTTGTAEDSEFSIERGPLSPGACRSDSDAQMAFRTPLYSATARRGPISATYVLPTPPLLDVDSEIPIPSVGAFVVFSLPGSDAEEHGSGVDLSGTDFDSEAMDSEHQPSAAGRRYLGEVVQSDAIFGELTVRFVASKRPEFSSPTTDDHSEVVANLLPSIDEEAADAIPSLYDLGKRTELRVVWNNIKRRFDVEGTIDDLDGLEPWDEDSTGLVLKQLALIARDEGETQNIYGYELIFVIVPDYEYFADLDSPWGSLEEAEIPAFFRSARSDERSDDMEESDSDEVADDADDEAEADDVEEMLCD